MSTVTDKVPPSALAVSLSSLLLGLVAGYFIGQGSSIDLFSFPSSSPSKKSSRRKEKKSWPNSYDVTIQPDSSTDEAPGAGAEADNENEESDSDDELSGEIKTFEDTGDEVKLMLVVRTDLGMTKGKIAAQCGHATLACYKSLLLNRSASSLLRRWENNGQPKVAVQCKSEEELLLLQAQAVSLGLCARVIHDAGRTQIAAGSATVLGVLGPKGVVDQVTGGLKLL